MPLITLEMGPSWKMEFLRGVLEEHGVAAFVADANLKLIDPLMTGALSFDSRLQVQAEALESARAALAEARAEGEALQEPTGEAQDPAPGALDELADLGRRIRWATVLFWMHPFVFVYGVRYLRALRSTPETPAGHALTLAALVLVGLVWGGMLFAVFLFGQ